MTCPFSCGPQAPQRNPPIREEFYTPQSFQISAITSNSFDNTQITTAVSNDFVVGQQVRFVIPPLCRMQALNGQNLYITQILDDQNFIVDFDVRSENAFNPTGDPSQLPLVNPTGDINSGPINNDGAINNIIYIDGSFRNIG